MSESPSYTDSSFNMRNVTIALLTALLCIGSGINVADHALAEPRLPDLPDLSAEPAFSPKAAPSSQSARQGKTLADYGYEAEYACTLRSGYEQKLGWKLLGTFIARDLRVFANVYTALYKLERFRTAKLMRIGPPQNKRRLARRWMQARREAMERLGVLVDGVNQRKAIGARFAPTVRWLIHSGERARFDVAEREHDRLARKLRAYDCTSD